MTGRYGCSWTLRRNEFASLQLYCYAQIWARINLYSRGVQGGEEASFIVEIQVRRKALAGLILVACLRL